MMLRLTMSITALIILSFMFLSCSSPTTNPPKTGDLKIEVTGLSSGLKADIVVSGPGNYNKSYDTTIVIKGLPIGNYTVTAHSIVDSLGDTMQATPPTQQVTVVEGSEISAQVQYNFSVPPQYGFLDITVIGLPTSLNANIEVRNASMTNTWPVTGSQTLDSMEVGVYTILPNSVLDLVHNDIYAPQVDTLYRSVVAGDTTRLTVTYNRNFYFDVYTKDFYNRFKAQISYQCCATSTDCITENPAKDYFASGMLSGFTFANCDSIIDNNITDTGYTKSVTLTHTSGTANGSQTLSVDSNVINISTTISVQADTLSCSYYGKTIFDLYWDWNPHGYEPATIIDIRNTKNDTVTVTFDWTVSGTATYNLQYGGDAGSDCVSNLHIYGASSPCSIDFSSTGQLAAPYTYYRGVFDSTTSGGINGSYSYTFTDSRKLLGVWLAQKLQAAASNVATSSSNLTSTLTITINR